MLHPLDRKLKELEANVEMVKEVEKAVSDMTERIEKAIEFRNRKVALTTAPYDQK